jgi:7-cyano-7-deazaguanine synthase
MQKKALVLHSGGFDSSLCLALAAKEFGKEHVLSLSFRYNQRHAQELIQAEKICTQWGIDHTVLAIDCLQEVTQSALIGKKMQIAHDAQGNANTLVVGRNGLMARLAAIYAHQLGANYLYLGVIADAGQQNGYRDCTRAYMDLKQQILRLDLENPAFEIRTPLVHLNKTEAMELAYTEGLLEQLLKQTLSCYEGVLENGCRECPACQSRHQALKAFLQRHPAVFR